MSSRTDDRFERAYRASLRAYECGRLRMAAIHAVTFCLLSAALSLLFVGAHGLVWLPLTLLAWGFVEWRGGGLLGGGRIGAVAGIVTLALPMSILRRCCKPGALAMVGADCCSMPGACAAAGVVVGFALACFLPTNGKRRDVVLGMVAGIAAVAPMKCSTLLVGEALGLVGGLLAGVVATSAARAVLERLRVRF